MALGLLALSIIGFPFGRAPLAVLAVTAVFAFDPAEAGRHARDAESTEREPPADPGDSPDPAVDDPALTDSQERGADGPSPGPEAVTDGGDRASVDGERPPWF